MRIRSLMPITGGDLSRYVLACKKYVDEHPGFTYRDEELDVVSEKGENVIFPAYAGAHYTALVHPDDFTLPGLIPETGVLQVHVKDCDRMRKILCNRSGIDLSREKYGRIFLHDGQIEIQPNADKYTYILWYGGAEVTKHVAALLGLLKDVT